MNATGLCIPSELAAVVHGYGIMYWAGKLDGSPAPIGILPKAAAELAAAAAEYGCDAEYD